MAVDVLGIFSPKLVTQSGVQVAYLASVVLTSFDIHTVAMSFPKSKVRSERCSMPIQAQVRPSSMFPTGLSEASVVTSDGAGMKSGMPLIWASSPVLMAWN